MPLFTWSWLITAYFTGRLNRCFSSPFSHSMLSQLPSTSTIPAGVTMNIAFCVAPKRYTCSLIWLIDRWLVQTGV